MTDWTHDRIRALRADWAAGLSTAVIGRRLGVSKNAVIGKVHRLDLEPRQSPIKMSDADEKLRLAAQAARRALHSKQKVTSTLPPLASDRPLPVPVRPTLPPPPPSTPAFVDRPPPVVHPRPALHRPPPPVSNVVPFISASLTCQYIKGNGRPWTKCGVGVCEPGGAWCAAHRKKVYVPRVNRREVA